MGFGAAPRETERATGSCYITVARQSVYCTVAQCRLGNHSRYCSAGTSPDLCSLHDVGGVGLLPINLEVCTVYCTVSYGVQYKCIGTRQFHLEVTT
jgi:hypothetical protein